LEGEDVPQVLYFSPVSYCACTQGLATREVKLGKRETDGDGILRTQRVSVACLVPVRKGIGLGGEKKETEVGVKIARPSVPIKALTDQSQGYVGRTRRRVTSMVIGGSRMC
jgi:hypothetical protein